MDSGFGDEESYNTYDKALFANRGEAGIYKHNKERFDQTEGKLASIGNSKFAGTEEARAAGVSDRTAPVEFEAEDDPFGLGGLLQDAKKRK